MSLPELPSPLGVAGSVVGALEVSVEGLVHSHLPLVGYLVNELIVRLPGHVRRDDLSSAGMAALASAAVSFEPERGVPFARYATVRIRGALLDDLRSNDWVSRSVRARARARDGAVEQLSAVLGRVPTSAEIAAHLGVEVSEVDAGESDVHRAVVLSLQGFQDSDVIEAALPNTGETPEEVLLRRERVGYLRAAIAALPERLRLVVEKYFLDGQPMADIAAELGVGESRVSQLRAEALVLLREGMTASLDTDRATPVERPGGVVDRRRAAYVAAVAAHSDFRSRLTPLAEEGNGARQPGTRVTA
ncbi:RNA polymerase sigma factor FliA [mine drainage metagenome]|uniref:RNA polymerase sigma factor FliA n=1 Tax=mine drainage metagenome TaxID=410659 RepID=A0A1J5QV13_9ZZZZ